MSSKRPLSNPSAHSSSIVEEKKNKKLKGLELAIPNSEGIVVKENYPKIQSVEIQSIKDDPSKIEAMTVQELRTTLRNVGIPAKGRKSDLVAALKHFVVKNLDGQGSQQAEEHISSIFTENISLQNKAGNVLDETINTVSEVSSFKQIKRRVKQFPAKDETVKVDAEIITTKEKLQLKRLKSQEKDVESIKQCLIDGYENSFWTCSHSKLGYSGTAIVSRIKPLSVSYGLGIPDHDSEGRLVTAEFDSFYLINAYVPNSGDGLKRLSYRVTQWDSSLSNYMKELEKSKPVILTGDLNCAHQEIDIYNPAGNRRSAGFTDEERQSFGTNFLSRGFVDTFRKQHPIVVGYTYWGYRHGTRKTNKGWRLDYFLVSESIADKVHDSYIVPDVAGSDHCPIGLILKV
ncbi:hypothetical protein GH714_035617 [Hevea brasiliensis]|uniref:DNA-(apurinic or apyrimidinic site) endonuclease n=1 Tax=Hevea brasiliensis TaxID=3981 RepID=A0A6A6M5N0_HEVBR|nr:hypothetical protein GH714_035617 [Hevea brasiliensis]